MTFRKACLSGLSIHNWGLSTCRETSGHFIKVLNQEFSSFEHLALNSHKMLDFIILTHKAILWDFPLPPFSPIAVLSIQRQWSCPSFLVGKTKWGDLAQRECYLSETGITAETFYCCQELGISKAWSPAEESLKERLKGKAFGVVAKTRIRFLLPCEVTHRVMMQYRGEPFLSTCKH